MVYVTYILDEGLLVLLQVQGAIALPAQDLEEEDSEAEHVGLDREDALQGELRRHVPAAFAFRNNILLLLVCA